MGINGIIAHQGRGEPLADRRGERVTLQLAAKFPQHVLELQKIGRFLKVLAALHAALGRFVARLYSSGPSISQSAKMKSTFNPACW